MLDTASLRDACSGLLGATKTVADAETTVAAPFRTWAAVHLRTLREQRTHEINAPHPSPEIRRTRQTTPTAATAAGMAHGRAARVASAAS